MSSTGDDNLARTTDPASTPRRAAPSQRTSVSKGQSLLAAGVVLLGGLSISIAVVGVQAWTRSAEAADRDLADASAPFNRELATLTPAGNSSDAGRMLVAQRGRVGWATTQPAPVGPPAGVAAGPVVPGLNKARVMSGLAAYQRFGCAACHTTDGKQGVGPSLYNAFGSHADLASGVNVLVDADYIRESIRQPAAKVHKGYQPVMPDFGSQIKDREIDGLIEFIKSISPDPSSRKETGPVGAPAAP